MKTAQLAMPPTVPPSQHGNYAHGYNLGAHAKPAQVQAAHSTPRPMPASRNDAIGHTNLGFHDGATADEGERQVHRDGAMQRALESRLGARDKKFP